MKDIIRNKSFIPISSEKENIIQYYNERYSLQLIFDNITKKSIIYSFSPIIKPLFEGYIKEEIQLEIILNCILNTKFNGKN